MIIFYKNYKRTERTLLSIQSVRHFYPEMDIRCLNLYDVSQDEYDSHLDNFRKLNVGLYFDKKTYNFGSSSVGSANNGFYFTEGINKIQLLVSDVTEKVFILDEDQFFTTGETLRFLLNTEFDFAYSHWKAPNPLTYVTKPTQEVNGAFIAIVPTRVSKYFPLPEKYEYIENLLGHELHDKCVSDGLSVVNIPTRHYDNYFGDGVHTNDIGVIKSELNKHGIGYSI